MSTNLLVNPGLVPEVVTTYPGIILGRGATIDGDCIVFDGTGHAPFVTFLLGSSLTAGDTYRINQATLDLAGNLQVATEGDAPSILGTISAADGETPPGGYTFVATGTESGYTVKGDLHDCVARFRKPVFNE